MAIFLFVHAPLFPVSSYIRIYVRGNIKLNILLMRNEGERIIIVIINVARGRMLDEMTKKSLYLVHFQRNPII